MTDRLPDGPTAEDITDYITRTYPDAVVGEAMNASFFSLDESMWPNFATIVTTDEHDEDGPSRLSREDVFRLNIGVSRQTYDRLVGTIDTPDYAALDTVLPHPVYARQHWISILNPSHATFECIMKALLAEAHDRLAAQRARHGRGI